ncbi:unnamed protein product [Brassica oleracea var. botrytis]
MCFLDHNFSQSWREQYQLFKTSEPDHKGLGRVLPGGASIGLLFGYRSLRGT